MDRRRDVLEAAVARGDAPFLVGLVTNGNGMAFCGAAGDASPGRPAGPDTVFRAFSMTKAVAAVAAMILAERGRLDLDAPVTAHLPEFARIQVLDGWDGEAPRLRAPRSVATVRQLVTHTAGFAYSHWNADMRRYRAVSGLPAMASGARAALFYPLIADPGACWSYGIATDWLGLAIGAAAGQSIDAFCAEAIFAPLGLDDTAFELDAATRPRLARASARSPDGGFAPLEIAPPATPEFRGMGDALYSSPRDYLRVLRLFLGGGCVDGVRLLTPTTVAAMLENQIGPLRVGPMISTSARISADVDYFPGTPKSHSLIGMRTEADVPGMRHAGSSGWSGIANSQWWVDPNAGVAAVLMTQTMPFMEPRFAATFAAFERAVYAA